MNRALAALSVSALAVTCALGLSAAPASASQATTEPNLPCGTTEPDLDDVTPTYQFLDYPGVINIRTGTTSECSIVGQIDRLEAFNYNCFVWDAIGRSWTYLHTSGNEHGWVLDSSLPDNGSPVHC
ncbi:hypothetical protein [Streptomyces sp.]|uniref:hypothetical protein n=1 Tax=Streptomyces sp. TaxID=1931 RepID=UPI002F3F19F7